ncbi:hypothetical protein FXO37_15966 [Capsicum annuum]|nr:hypothetical protein FXO37_15966 [Capsicum annuum]
MVFMVLLVADGGVWYWLLRCCVGVGCVGISGGVSISGSGSIGGVSGGISFYGVYIGIGGVSGIGSGVGGDVGGVGGRGGIDSIGGVISIGIDDGISGAIYVGNIGSVGSGGSGGGVDGNISSVGIGGIGGGVGGVGIGGIGGDGGIGIGGGCDGGGGGVSIGGVGGIGGGGGGVSIGGVGGDGGGGGISDGYWWYLVWVVLVLVVLVVLVLVVVVVVVVVLVLWCWWCWLWIKGSDGGIVVLVVVLVCVGISGVGLGKSEADKRYENDIEEGGEGSVEASEENRSEEEKEEDKEEEEKVESAKDDNNASSMKRELRSKSYHDPVKTIIAIDLGVPFGGIAGGVVDVGGSHAYADIADSHDEEHVDDQEKINAYDASDRIMDLNFYSNFKNKYDDLIQLESTPSGSRFDLLVSWFIWDKDMIEYVREKRPYPYDMDWIKTKIIFIVMNGDIKYFLALEILLEDGIMKVYDYNLPVIDESNFFTKMQPLLDLLPSLLKQSKLMNHFLVKLLNEKWDFKGRNKDKELPKKLIGVACGSYVLAHIKYWLTNIEISNSMTFLCDNIVARMQEVWAYGVVTKRLDPVYVKKKM